MIIFSARGHRNMLATHQSTIEFTRHDDLTKNGDCILGVCADFDARKLMQLTINPRLQLRIRIGHLADTVVFSPNPGFKDTDEIVIRKSGFLSSRTLGIMADKAASGIDRRIIRLLADPATVAQIEIDVYEKGNEQ